MVAIVALAACREAPARSPFSTRTDSAGLTIVTLTGSPDQLPEWLVDPLPRLTLQSPDSAGFVFVSAAHWLRDAWLVVADARALGVYIYNASGQHQRTLGRRGDGPGEFRGLMTVSVVGDTIGTWDLSQRRFSRFTADSGFRTLVPTPPAPGDYDTAREAWGMSGQRVLTYWLHADVPSPLPQGVRIRRWPSVAELTLSDSEGAPLASTPRFNGSYSGEFARGDARQAFSNVPFVATSPSRVAWGSGERFEVFIADELLRVRRIVRWGMADEPLGAAEVARARDGIRASLPPGAPPERIEQVLNDIVAVELLPTVRPAISRALYDDTGWLWLGRFEAPERGLAESYDWVVLDTTGVPQGRMRLAHGTRLEAVRGNRVLVSVRDSLDVQRVEVRELDRAGVTSPDAPQNVPAARKPL